MPASRNSFRAATLAGILLVAACTQCCSAEQAIKGRAVVDVLEELRDDDLQFIYSSGLLTGAEQVRSEPHARDPLGIAREILADHRLGVSSVAPGLYAVVPLPAGKLALRGHIVDPSTRQGIGGVRIEVLPPGSIHWSDIQGRFAIEVPPSRTYTLRVSADGYTEAEVAEVRLAADARPLDITLDHAQPEPSEITVAASRYAVSHSPSIGSFLLHGSLLASRPSLGDDPIRTLAHLPGMSQSGYSAQSNVRGGEPGEVLVLLDGFPLRQPFHLPGYHKFFSVVDPALIDEAEVYTGGFPVRYGNRLSGVFDLQTASAATEPRRAAGLSFFNAMARQGGVNQSMDAQWLMVARVGTLKPLVGIFAPDAGDPSYSDIYARAAFGRPEALKVSGNMLWARDELAIEATERGERAQMESRSRYLWLRADRQWESGLAGSLWLGHSRIDSVRRGSISNPDIALGALADSRASKLWDLRTLLSWQPQEHHWLEAGAEWTREDADYRYDAAVAYTPQIAALFARDASLTRRLSLEPARDRIALFGAHRWQLTDALTAEVGLRAQRILTKGSDNQWIHDPRVSARWQLNPRTSLRAHWGRFHQADEIQELKIEDGLLNFPRAQRAEHVIAGIEHQLPSGLALRGEAFSKNQSRPRARFENILDPLSLLPEIAADRVEVAPDSSESRGVEVSAAYGRHEWTGWTSLTWSKVYDHFAGTDVPRSWDQTWSTTAGLQWSRGPWQLGAVASVHRGWPTTHLVTGPDGDTYLESRNRSRLPTYATLDARAAYNRALDRGRLTLAIELTNILNRRNACCSQLAASPAPDGSATIHTEQLNWLPLVPSLSVLWEF